MEKAIQHDANLCSVRKGVGAAKLQRVGAERDGELDRFDHVQQPGALLFNEAMRISVSDFLVWASPVALWEECGIEPPVYHQEIAGILDSFPDDFRVVHERGETTFQATTGHDYVALGFPVDSSTGRPTLKDEPAPDTGPDGLDGTDAPYGLLIVPRPPGGRAELSRYGVSCRTGGTAEIELRPVPDLEPPVPADVPANSMVLWIHLEQAREEGVQFRLVGGKLRTEGIDGRINPMHIAYWQDP